MSMRDRLLKIGRTTFALTKQGKQDTVACVRLEQSVEIPPTMELVVTGIAENKLQYAGGSSALLTASASPMTDTGVVVCASLVSIGTKHVPIVLLHHTDQSIFLRKGGTVGVHQSVSLTEVFNVSDGNLSREGFVEAARQIIF